MKIANDFWIEKFNEFETFLYRNNYYKEIFSLKLVGFNHSYVIISVHKIIFFTQK